MKIIDCLLPSLREVIDEGHSLDRVTARWIAANRGQWADRDVAMFAETLSAVVRWWRLLRSLAHAVGFEGASGIGPIAVYQALNPSVSIVREQLSPWQRRTLEREYSRLYDHRAVRESIPDWLDALCARELGKEWEKTLAALNTLPSIVLRANRLRTSRQSLMAMLANEGYKVAALGDADAIQQVGLVVLG